MKKTYRWIKDSNLQQVSLLLISSILLMYSVVNLVVRTRILSIGFVWLSGILFVLCVINWKTCRTQIRIERDIRLIQKEYDAGMADRSSRLLSLSSMQRKLFQYIVSDYPVNELQHVFSFSLGRLSKEIHFLSQLLSEESEVGGRKSDGRGQRSEVRSQKSK